MNVYYSRNIIVEKCFYVASYKNLSFKKLSPIFSEVDIFSFFRMSKRSSLLKFRHFYKRYNEKNGKVQQHMEVNSD